MLSKDNFCTHISAGVHAITYTLMLSFFSCRQSPWRWWSLCRLLPKSGLRWMPPPWTDTNTITMLWHQRQRRFGADKSGHRYLYLWIPHTFWRSRERNNEIFVKIRKSDSKMHDVNHFFDERRHLSWKAWNTLHRNPLLTAYAHRHASCY